jgi:hypothetical protein
VADHRGQVAGSVHAPPDLPPIYAVKFGQVLYRGVSGGAELWRRPDATPFELGMTT